jgi:hypothetical protein
MIDQVLLAWILTHAWTEYRDCCAVLEAKLASSNNSDIHSRQAAFLVDIWTRSKRQWRNVWQNSWPPKVHGLANIQISRGPEFDQSLWLPRSIPLPLRSVRTSSIHPKRPSLRPRYRWRRCWAYTCPESWTSWCGMSFIHASGLILCSPQRRFLKISQRPLRNTRASAFAANLPL